LAAISLKANVGGIVAAGPERPSTDLSHPVVGGQPRRRAQDEPIEFLAERPNGVLHILDRVQHQRSDLIKGRRVVEERELSNAVSALGDARWVTSIVAVQSDDDIVILVITRWYLEVAKAGLLSENCE